MSKFATIAGAGIGVTCAIWSTLASAISAPTATRTVSAASLGVEHVALICRERCGYYGCRQICVRQSDFYGMYDQPPYGWHGYAREPWRDRRGHGHEHEHEHWGGYEHEREYEHED